MFDNPFRSAGFGIYRISETRIWPVFINRALWQLFCLSKSQFLQTVSPDNIFGGAYDKNPSLHSLFCQQNGLCTSEGTVTANAALPQAPLPLQITYSIRILDSNTTLLYFLVNTETSRNDEAPQENAATSIYNLVFQEANEISLDLDLQTHCMYLHSMRFTIESCWPVTIQELINLSIRIVHPEDIDQLTQKISEASSQICYGIINLRIHLLHETYRNINLWYSSSGIADRNVTKISILINSLSTDPSVLVKQILSFIKYRSNGNHLLQLCFNTSTGQRLETAYDVNLEYLPCMSYRRTLEALQNLLLYREDKPCIQVGVDRFNMAKAESLNYDYFYCDVRLYTDIHKNADNETACRWYRFEQEMIKDAQTGCSVVVISIYDIHEFKLAELKRTALKVLDPNTGLFTFDSFFHQYTLAVNNLKRSAHKQQALVILVMELQLDVSAGTDDCAYNEVIQKISRYIHAMTRKDDLIGRYSNDHITILLQENEKSEYLADRIHLLDHAIHIAASENNAQYRIGYHVLDSQNSLTAIQGLEKAQVALFWTRIPGQNHILGFSQSMHDQISQKVLSYTKNNENKPAAVKSVEIRTFGSFSLFVNGHAIPFVNLKAKELLAVLINKNGSFVTPGQAIACLWENEPCNKKTLSRLRKTVLLLKRELEKHNLQDMIESVNGNRRFVTADWITCDYFDFMDGKLGYICNPGIFMPEYSWAEETNAMLENRFFKPPSPRIVNESKRSIRFTAKRQGAQFPSVQT